MREKNIYEKIAEKYNTTPEEVRREMQIAIDTGFDNLDPAVQEEWKKMTLKGERPTPEEVINYAVKKTKRKIKI
ncbi:sporulation initiation factor Spo0A C-terminal domain-containing protein [[Ruminococcus] torques]|uniref:Sporulation initiation factor Spo0A n=1 Tax=[Ruminococcus] torques TaxID=33039 RepID=A0A4Q5C8C3_9FIRM|nr:sporulation initiation factor Spo0A C-terminal domain-containing protein [[Ruminococcus] torques]MTQ68397.1 sporulation initiation factor Spo0A [[Ruminococcus] torques]MTQ73702.1 sporulation initiation factor Spo0A [[Ruminococcus] torques]MTQ78115.1 sporulation initiation factor Spo0A [[Ruminococcus] torques]MTQ84344.1 sporulation initiation factor Spo0A [[Ruminococcus] torques]MTR59705.1 sporulation initiation factor Spo0A [[Ruminococcus] torques]